MFVLCRKDKGMMFYSPINSSALHVHLSICAKNPLRGFLYMVLWTFLQSGL